MTETATKPKRITLATFKSFARKNKGKLFLKVEGRFDGMIDCVSYRNDAAFLPATESTRPDMVRYDLGIGGLYLTRDGNWFKPFENDEFVGLTYDNCCGGGVLAIRK